MILAHKEQPKSFPIGYGPMYPSVWIVEEKGRGWWVTAAFSATDEVRDVCRTSDLAEVVADTWRVDLAHGWQLTCPDCAGDGSRPCRHCDGSGRASYIAEYGRAHYEGEQVVRNCPRTETCGRCRGTGALPK